MNNLLLYKFITLNKIEWHYTNDNQDVIVFINNYLLDEWNKLLGSHITDESGLECVMKDGYFCFEMKHICDYFDIDLTEIFDKSNEA